MIFIKNISKTFNQSNQKVRAVKDISLTIDKGDILGIVGTSGAGKSTVLNCINLLERPDSGQVWVNGINLTELSEKDLEKERKNIAMIFQHFNLFNQRSVIENVVYPIKKFGVDKKNIYKKGRELLELVGIADKENAYPNQLSGGQKQRVAIARALAGNPSVLLCDEVTSSLDPETTTAILRLLAEINKNFNITIVLITHEKSVVKQICNKVALMEDGRLIELTDTVSFFTNPTEESTERFVGTSLDMHEEKEKIFSYLKSFENDGSLCQLTFLNSTASEAFVSTASKMFDVEITILFGNIEFISNKVVGNLIVNISGNHLEQEKVISFFKDNKIIVKKVNLNV